jgi:hypothetical protein
VQRKAGAVLIALPCIKSSSRSQVSRKTRAPGLGADFIRQVERIPSEIVAHPNSGSVFVGSTIRRRLIQRFPFGIVYEPESANISVSL